MRTALLLMAAAVAAGAEPTAKFTSPMYFLPPIKEVVVTRADSPGPGADKHAAIASVALNAEAKLPDGGPFDVWIVPKDGKPVRAVGGYSPKDGANEVKVNEGVGVIAFRGDDQPRGTLLVTPVGDDGPESKGHKVIQTAADTRAEMVVPPGDYAVWVVPASGARARRVIDKVRVLPGKTASE